MDGLLASCMMVHSGSLFFTNSSWYEILVYWRFFIYVYILSISGFCVFLHYPSFVFYFPLPISLLWNNFFYMKYFVLTYSLDVSNLSSQTSTSTGFLNDKYVWHRTIPKHDRTQKRNQYTLYRAGNEYFLNEFGEYIMRDYDLYKSAKQNILQITLGTILNIWFSPFPHTRFILCIYSCACAYIDIYIWYTNLPKT